MPPYLMETTPSFLLDNYLQIKNVLSDSDVITVIPGSSSRIYALSAVPPGTIINAGAGDDLVYSGAGHDTIDGGSGSNTISYSLSSSGVTVSLQDGAGHGGYAEGDL